MHPRFVRLISLFALLVAITFAPFVAAWGQESSPEQQDQQRIADLVIANRILASQGILDSFGHVSVRSAKTSTHFYLSRSIAPGSVTADDILEYDENSNAIDAHGRSSYLERFIHGEIYRVRPDVQAIVHSHSPAVLPFGMSKVPLRAAFPLAGFLGTGVPVFEIRSVAGEDSDLLVTDRPRGVALAAVLGSAEIVLMRGHGDTVVGPSLKLAVVRAVYAEVDARVQMDAMRLGDPVLLTQGEVIASRKINDSDFSAGRPWEIWKERAMRELSPTK